MNVSPIPIRPTTDADLPRIAELVSEGKEDPTTADQIRDFEARLPADGDLIRLVALDAEGQTQATGSAIRYPHEDPESRKIGLATAKECRRQGYGSALLDALLAAGGRRFSADVRDDDPASLRFAERRGFVLAEHGFESILDLAAVDETLLNPPTDLRLLSLAEIGNDEANRRRLWDLNVETGRDQPGIGDDHFPTYDEWWPMAEGASWFDPEGQLLAADGDEWVGLCAVGAFSPGRFYNLFTGVRRSYRGRGVASALKALAIRHAKGQGGLTIRTNNHSKNAPMLAINRRLGYRPLPGSYLMRRGSDPLW